MSSKFSLILFIFSSLLVVFNGGYFAREFKLFPYKFYREASLGWKQLQTQQSAQLPWYYARSPKNPSEVVKNISQTQPGLSLVTEMAADDKILAKIIDLNGKTVHKWDIDWFEIWSNPEHLPESIVPKAQPGTNIHGAVVMKNGDLVFNFESKGLVRLDRDGEVVWRLPYITHHSVHQHDDGNDNLWVSGTRYQTEKVDRLPHLNPPFHEETILKVSPEGKILREWFIADILRDNGYKGLLYMGSLNNENPSIQGDGRLLGNSDILHLNDIEPFSEKLQPGFFQPGDVMVSLRNINTVFVFNIESGKIKFMSTGQFVRHHDPDFIDGDTISVFDNNNAREAKARSQILLISAQDNTSQVYFQGSKANKFFTRVMGKHQWQPNGNLLITESLSGRGFEIDRQGKLVWEYMNYVDDGVVGVVGEVQRLPPEYTQLFTKEE